MIDLWFYLGGILSHSGVAALAVGLAAMRLLEIQPARAHDIERSLALAAGALLVAGIVIQLQRLLS